MADRVREPRTTGGGTTPRVGPKNPIVLSVEQDLKSLDDLDKIKTHPILASVLGNVRGGGLKAGEHTKFSLDFSKSG